MAIRRRQWNEAGAENGGMKVRLIEIDGDGLGDRKSMHVREDDPIKQQNLKSK